MGRAAGIEPEVRQALGLTVFVLLKIVSAFATSIFSLIDRGPAFASSRRARCSACRGSRARPMGTLLPLSSWYRESSRGSAS
jgi:hypothetical protein